MATRRVLVILIMSLAVPCLLSACAEPTRHRILSFFFDGVPKPGEQAEIDAGSREGEDSQGASPTASSQPTSKPVVYYHAPYRQNRCQACHNIGSGALFREPSEGLCLTCHPDTPGRAKFVHGPVAVNNCTVCHNPHQSDYPKMLQKEPEEICQGCHDRASVSGGEYHADIASRSCLECHDPHGGNNRFFVKRAER